MSFSQPPETEPPVPRPELRAMAWHVVITVAVAAVVAAAALLWTGAMRDVLLVISELVIVAGTVGAGLRAYRTYRAGGRWQVWQGGLWAMLVVFLLWTMGVLPAVLV
ncbi:MAG: hypothetical protein QM774_08145 [Gordonia sp. (in: high G+C Gram-positive bacteria)]|uniref:hypothetical protein n=1 Tax=Gordonia sp. (in: high G+C Gram-positive bacteria) TaxID=84139 RepID=UPI0039E425AF